MREILFKAKRIDNGEWVEGYLVKYPSSKVEIFKECGEPPDILLRCEVDPETLCQCTGLKDKNGKRIWENDIIRDIEMGYQSVFFDSDIAGFALDDGKFENSFGEFYAGDCEVVGNIFDNAELLEQEN